MKDDKVYDSSDVRQVINNSKATNWSQLANFIRERGGELWHVTPEEAMAMSKDIERLEERGEDFTRDPKEIYKMVTSGSKKYQEDQQMEGRDEMPKGNYNIRTSDRSSDRGEGNKSLWDRIMENFK